VNDGIFTVFIPSGDILETLSDLVKAGVTTTRIGRLELGMKNEGDLGRSDSHSHRSVSLGDGCSIGIN
jgi:hypothetical protein